MNSEIKNMPHQKQTELIFFFIEKDDKMSPLSWSYIRYELSEMHQGEKFGCQIILSGFIVF